MALANKTTSVTPATKWEQVWWRETKWEQVWWRESTPVAQISFDEPEFDWAAFEDWTVLVEAARERAPEPLRLRL